MCHICVDPPGFPGFPGVFSPPSSSTQTKSTEVFHLHLSGNTHIFKYTIASHLIKKILLTSKNMSIIRKLYLNRLYFWLKFLGYSWCDCSHLEVCDMFLLWLWRKQNKPSSWGHKSQYSGHRAKLWATLTIQQRHLQVVQIGGYGWNISTTFQLVSMNAKMFMFCEMGKSFPSASAVHYALLFALMMWLK